MVAFVGDWTTAFVAALAASSSSSRSSVASVNKNERRFDEMVDGLTLSPAAIECMDSPRSRVLFRGIEAGCGNAEIRSAVCIVYQDLAPIRVAGDLIFGQLVVAANQAAGMHDELLTNEIANIDADANAAETLAKSRRLFDLVDGDNSGGLDRNEVLALPELMEFIRTGIDKDNVDNDNNSVVDRFMALADENGDGVVSFVEFANAAATQPQLRLVDDALATVLLSTESDSANGKQKNKKRGLFGRKPPEERFDDMLVQFLEWEERLGCGPGNNDETVATVNENDLTECKVDVSIEQKQLQVNGDEDERLLQVLKGALVGARCDPVVEALKMCYLDFSPLRLGGDIIFKLLGRVVRTQLPP